jgi:hypothetical protein
MKIPNYFNQYQSQDKNNQQNLNLKSNKNVDENQKEKKSNLDILLKPFGEKCDSKNFLQEFNNICTLMFKNYYIEKEKYSKFLKESQSQLKDKDNSKPLEIRRKFIPLNYFILIRKNNNSFVNLLKNGLNNKGEMNVIFDSAEKMLTKKHGNNIENYINDIISLICRGISLENLEEYLKSNDEKSSNMEKIYSECKLF